MHIYDPAMPVAPTALGPGPAWASLAAYRAVMAGLGIERVVVVQPTSYGTDNRCTEQAIAGLGLASARGIAVIDTDVTDAELKRLDRAGIRGARFQMLPGGAIPWDMLEPIAKRIAPLGWHCQVQMDGRLFPEREALLKRLPTPVMIDHVGKFLEPVPVGHDGVRSLLRMLETGRFWMKLSAPYEVSKVGGPLYEDVGAIAKACVQANPERLVWASNWPHVSVTTLPDDALLLDILLDWAPKAEDRQRILVDTPASFYGF
jgi:D-galactarolactone isomerase